jgi:hypothetical protein
MVINKSFQESNCKSVENENKIMDFWLTDDFLVEIDSVHHRQIPHRSNIQSDSLPNVEYSDEITLKRRLNLWSGICVIVGITIGK